MVKIIAAFVVMFGLFFVGIKYLQTTTTGEKWKLTKVVLYSMLCAALALGVMTGFVILF